MSKEVRQRCRTLLCCRGAQAPDVSLLFFWKTSGSNMQVFFRTDYSVLIIFCLRDPLTPPKTHHHPMIQSKVKQTGGCSEPPQEPRTPSVTGASLHAAVALGEVQFHASITEILIRGKGGGRCSHKSLCVNQNPQNASRFHRNHQNCSFIQAQTKPLNITRLHFLYVSLSHLPVFPAESFSFMQRSPSRRLLPKRRLC